MKKFSERFSARLRAVIALTLAFSLIAAPMTVIAAEINEQYQSISIVDEQVSEMLAKGPYIEGQAIAIMFKSDIPKNGYLGSAEELMGTTKESYELTTGEQLNNFKVTDEIEDLAIVLVEEDGLTTEELLHRLLRDNRIISAEPNYVIPAVEPNDGEINVPEGESSGVSSNIASSSDAEKATSSDASPSEDEGVIANATGSETETEEEEYPDGAIDNDVNTYPEYDESEEYEEYDEGFLDETSLSSGSLTKERYHALSNAIKAEAASAASAPWGDETELSNLFTASPSQDITKHQWYVYRDSSS